MDVETERIYYKKMAKSTFHFSFVLIHTLKQFSTAHATLLTKSELLSFNFRKFYFEPDRNVEMGSRH